MKHNLQLARKQLGFTLVEIAIVLVIIGLLLGGVLKGQEMIENGRIKSVVADMAGVSAAYNTYQDRYHALPGDETNATMGARGWLGNATGNADGVLTIAANAAFLNTGEQAAMWRGLRAAGLAAGDPTAPASILGLPKAGNGGLIGVAVGVYGMTGPAVCVSNLTTKQAAAIDVAIDGPLPANNIGNNVGSVRGDTGALANLPPAALVPGPLAYNEVTTTTNWTMCRKL